MILIFSNAFAEQIILSTCKYKISLCIHLALNIFLKYLKNGDIGQGCRRKILRPYVDWSVRPSDSLKQVSVCQ